jgi:hypothetical protein
VQEDVEKVIFSLGGIEPQGGGTNIVADADEERESFHLASNRPRPTSLVPNSDSEFIRTITKNIVNEASSEKRMKRSTRRLLNFAKKDAEKPLFLSKEPIDERSVQTIAESTDPRIGDAFRPHTRLTQDRIEPY